MSDPLFNDPVAALLAQTSLQNNLFAPNSRYFGLPTSMLSPPGCEKPIVYLLRRFVPPPERFQVIQEHTVVQDDRLDRLAGQYLGDATLFWRLCDANRAMRPDDLTATPGATVAITLPEGVTGSSM
ncbi:nucleoid-associated protein YgaU [Paraburkholderia sp. Clong3]|uniref:LysM domain-containing protein n=1 Tax=unclassified Paraburkholderia TaxID=2615204 RepID=UPI00160A1901|nr:LysM domain-containing protein [Paraburkholderia sp. CI2]MBB5470982.1 nucleoid-associated protein YgaU [Paraburkholderia sp. CI2]